MIYCSVLDSSCGDMTWMPSFLSSRSDVEFTGYDIVEANINNHRENFKETDWKFETHDIETDPIKISYDLIAFVYAAMVALGGIIGFVKKGDLVTFLTFTSKRPLVT